MSAKRWANVECEGTACSVGPFLSDADADLFRSLMFSPKDYGETSPTPSGRKMTVRQFQDAFRADFVGEAPPAHWRARV